MKKILSVAFVVAVAVFFACSCEKSGTGRFKGNYSFKTSGTVRVVRCTEDRFDTLITERRRRDTTGVKYDTTWVWGIPGGTVERVDTNYVTEWNTYKDTVISEFPDSTTISISTESGQMDITEIDRSTGDMVITMNVTGGDMVVYYAVAEGDKIVLTPQDRHFSLGTASAHIGTVDEAWDVDATSMEADVTVSGTGVRYDNIILFDLKYDGTYTYNDIKYDILDSKIDCRAKLNE